jgi:hypothetical protein
MKLHLESDYSSYLRLIGFQRREMTQIEVYRACIIDAINGIRNQEEEHLTPLQKQLLDARRLMNTNQIEAASRLIRRLNHEITPDLTVQKTTENQLLYGDLSFITGTLATIKGDFKTAGHKMNQSALFYEQANNPRRVHKALINEQICNYNSLFSYETGVLNAFKRSCLQHEFHDLVANILRSHAFELLVEGHILQATYFAKQAQLQYSIDGYPDDQMTALAIESIGHALLNDLQQAKNIFLELTTESEKTKNKGQVYLNVLKDLLFGRIPTPPPTHPLSRVPWKQLIIKTGSLKAKLIEILRVGPQTRDKLISQLWGETAIHPSYNQRLHSLIGEIRDSRLHFVHFDGDLYRLI